MTKIKNRILIVLALVMLCAVGVFALAACNDTETYTVTFMVRKNGTTGDWQQYTTVDTNDDGSVTLPAEPTVDGYTFRDWYTDEACSADNVFDETSVSGDITVYALMAEANITLNVTDGSGTATQIAGTLSALSQTTSEQEAAAAEENLTFDGWYTDAAFTQKYSSGMDATALYGRYMAKVTYDNGYESDSIFVVPGQAMSQPSDDMIVKSYMSPDDIYYVYSDKPINDDGSFNDVDFTQPVEENTSITVQWKTPDIRELSYRENAVTGNIVLDYWTNSAVADANYPVISMPSRVTLNGVERKVEVVSGLYLSSDYIGSAAVIIYQEGIQGILFNEADAQIYPSSVTKISLPSTLLIIDNSFNYLRMLEEVEIPENVEVILESFWKETSGESYDFEIAIPDSVINLSDVPTNFTFGSGSSFHKDGENIIYQQTDNGKVLIVDLNVIDGVLEVPEGYEGIQVAAFNHVPDMLYLHLPESWSFVQHNVELYNTSTGEGYYPFYAGVNSVRSLSALWNEVEDPVNNINGDAYSIVKNLDDLEYVIIYQTEFPQDVADYALIGVYEDAAGDDVYGTYSQEFSDKVYFLHETTGAITVNVKGINDVSGDEYQTAIESTSGSIVTEEQLIAALETEMGLSAGDFADQFEVVSILEFGKTVDLTEAFNRDMYLEITYTYANLGIITEENADGTLTVTGFDKDHAELVGENTYLVIIPNEIDGKAITAIADEAFMGEPVARVLIGNGIKTIGARAFKDTTSLASVEITPGGLEVIGESAFENSGFTSIELSLATITDIGPNAFKSAALQKFIPVAEERNTRVLYSNPMNKAVNFNPMESEEFSGYFFMAPGSYSVYTVDQAYGVAILKYVSKTENVEAPALNDYDPAIVTVYDVQLIAVAGGMVEKSFTLGYSNRGFAMIDADPETGFVVRFEVMEGSVYYLNNVTTLKFGLVSKVHEGAFTAIDSDLTDVEVFRSSYMGNYRVAGVTEFEIIWDAWIDLEEITSVGSSSYDFTASDALFEDGWWCGVYSTDADYEQKMQFMAGAQYGLSGPNGDPENEGDPWTSLYGDIMLTM